MKKTKKKLSIVMGLFIVVLVATFDIWQNSQSKIKAENPQESSTTNETSGANVSQEIEPYALLYQDLYNYPGIILVDKDSTPIPGDYASTLRLTNKTTYSASNLGSWSNGNERWEIKGGSVNGTNILKVNKLGIYNGAYFDLQVRLKEFTGNSGSTVRVHAPTLNGKGTDEFLQVDISGSKGDSLDVEYTFLDSLTGKPISYKGMWNLKRINKRKAATISSNSDFLKRLYALSTTTISYNQNDNDTIMFYNSKSALSADSSNEQVTYLFDSESGIFVQTMSMNSGLGYLKYDTDSIARLVLPAPQPVGLTEDNTTKISYDIFQDMPIQTNASWYTKNYTMYINVDPIFDLSTATMSVEDVSGKDSSSKFNIQKDSDNNRFVITVPSSTLSSSSFVDNSYEFNLSGDFKEGIDKEPYLQSDGYLHVPLVAYNITDDGESTHNTGTAKVKLSGQPTGDPVAQTVVKGTGTADLNPADLVKNLKGVLGSETVTATGFETEKTFSTTGDDSVVVLIKGDKTDFVGKVTVPIKVIGVSNTATVQNITDTTSTPGASVNANYKDTIQYSNVIAVDKTSNGFSTDGNYSFPLPTGIVYKTGSFKIDGVPVSDDQLVISDTGIVYAGSLVDNKSTTYTFEGTVMEKAAKTLSSTFSFEKVAGVAITTSNQVDVTTSGIPQLDAKIDVFGVDSEAKEADGTYKQITKFGEIDQKVYDYGDSIDISKDSIVTAGKADLINKGWEFQNKVQQLKDGSYADITDTSVITTEQTGSVIYLYKAKVGTIVTSFVDKDGNTLAEDVSITARIPDGPVDLTKETKVTDTLSSLAQQKYAVTTRPANETAINVTTDKATTVKYVLEKRTADEAAVFSVYAGDIDDVLSSSLGSYKTVNTLGDLTKYVIDYGDTVDISSDAQLVKWKSDLEAKGWIFKDIKQTMSDTDPSATYYYATDETKLKSYKNGTSVQYGVKAKTGTIVVQFVDEDGESLADEVSTVVRIPDGNVDLTKVTAVTDTLNNLTQYQVESAPDNEKAVTPKADETVTVKYVLKKKHTVVDPEDGVTPFTPEKEGSSEAAPQSESKKDLRIQYVSNFDFGATNRTFVNDQSILSVGDYGTPEGKTAKKVPAFISVNDDRKTPTGWDLSVATKDFIQSDNGTILKGAYMTLSNFEYKGPATQKPTVSTDKVEISDAAQIVSSDSIGMNGSWSLALGELTDSGKSNGVNLTIPKNSPGSLGDYSTDIYGQ